MRFYRFRERDQRFGQVRHEDELVWCINWADHVSRPALQRSVEDRPGVTLPNPWPAQNPKDGDTIT